MNISWISPASAFDASYFRQAYILGLAVLLITGGNLFSAAFAVQFIFWIVLTAAFFGIFTRFFLLLLVLIGIRLFGYPPFTNTLTDYYLDLGLILVTARCADAFTIDGLFQARSRGAAGDIHPPKNSIVYAWPLRAIWLMGIVGLTLAHPENPLTFNVFLIVYAISFTPLSAMIRQTGQNLFPEPLFVVYDGNCKLCRGTAASLNSIDEFGRLTYVNGMDEEQLKTYSLTHLDRQRLAEDIHVVSKGKVFTGFYGYREMAWRIPVFWLLIPLMYLQPFPQIAQKIYRKVADSRGCSVVPASVQLQWIDPPVRFIDGAAPAAVFLILLTGHLFNL